MVCWIKNVVILSESSEDFVLQLGTKLKKGSYTYVGDVVSRMYQTENFVSSNQHSFSVKYHIILA